ncbi:MAG: hypothetical protein ABII76_27225 [Pseudomonadota bacterium]
MTPPRKNAMTPEEKLEALGALECDVFDLVNMAGISATLAEQAFEDRKSHKVLAGGRENFFYLDDRQVDEIVFASYHTLKLLERFRAAFLRAKGLDG